MSKKKRNIKFPRKIALSSRVVFRDKGPPFVSGGNTTRD
jgi:hypothetical protein